MFLIQSVNPLTILLVVVIILVLMLVVIVAWWIGVSNTIKRMVVKIDEAESGIDVALTKRFDWLTKAIATAKGYAKHEKETLEQIVNLRNPGRNATMDQKQEFSNKLSEAVTAFNVIVEKYPDLKADTQFTQVQRAIGEVEEQLQAARRLYNSNVSIYNQRIIVFPSSIVANAGGFKRRAFFEADASKREDVKVEF